MSNFSEEQGSSNGHVPAKISVQKYYCRALDGHPQDFVGTQVNQCTIPPGKFSVDSLIDSPQIAPEFSCGVLSCQQLLIPRPSDCESASLTGAGTIPHATHITLRRTHAIQKANSRAPISQPLTRPFVAGSQNTSYPFDLNGSVRAEYFECDRSDGSRPHGAAAERPGGATVLGPMRSRARNDPLLSPGILQDADLLLSVSPNILDEEVLYNRIWTSQDIIMFNGILIDESEITCLWVGRRTTCNDRVKIKDMKTHLNHKHGVKSGLRPYKSRHKCFWQHCSVSHSMKRSSLERHIQERHCPVKWACPFCDNTFTRKSTLLRHLERCPGDYKSHVEPQRLLVSGQ